MKARRIKCAEHLASLEQKGNAVVVGKHKGKKPLEKPRRRWEVNIEMELQEIGKRAETGLIWLWIRTSEKVL